MTSERREDRLYEQVAAKVRGLIMDRIYRPGDRLPSVRELSRQCGVSITTVLDAYRLLEDQGLIHPRPQSGYYVHAYANLRLAEPTISSPSKSPSHFTRDEMLQAMTHQIDRKGLVELAFANPDPDLLPLAKLARLIGAVAREHPEASYGYGPPSGHRAIREQIAQRAFAAGAVISPNEVVITMGCQEAMCLALRAVCRPGAVVAVESPCHYGVLQAIQLAGLRSLEIRTRSREGISLDSLESAAFEQKRIGSPIEACLVSPNFQNPLGSCMSDADKKELIAIAGRNDIVLIEDDVYGDLGFEGGRPKVLRAFEGGENVVLCSSFSKTIAPGYRVGWVVAGKWHTQIERLKHSFTISAPSLPQLVIADFLTDGGYDQYLRRARKTYAANVGRMSEAVAKYFPPETLATRPLGGYVLWIQLPDCLDSVALYAMALERNVFLCPGLLFSTGDGYRRFIRLSASRWSAEVETGLATIGECIHSLRV
ncbi:MAG: PLP-dependent aminotransferase family protein [Fimbriimonas sp.]|nr:PLP-dependent aminotransferase family protein [Fimbriimonas sp.]